MQTLCSTKEPKILKEAILSFEVPYSIKSLSEFFNDLRKYAKLHPLILAAEQVGTNPPKFRITEKPFPYLPVKIKYYATIQTTLNEIVYNISGIPFTEIEIRYTLSSLAPQLSRIQCRITLQSKLIGRSILFKKLQSAQNELIKALNKKIPS